MTVKRYSLQSKMAETDNGFFVPHEDYQRLERERDAWRHEAILYHCTWRGITYEESAKLVQEYIDDAMKEDKDGT